MFRGHSTVIKFHFPLALASLRCSPESYVVPSKESSTASSPHGLLLSLLDTSQRRMVQVIASHFVFAFLLPVVFYTTASVLGSSPF